VGLTKTGTGVETKTEEHNQINI